MRKIRIATIYISRPIRKFEPVSMDMIRWLKISEFFATAGYQVDMIVNCGNRQVKNVAPNLRMVPYAQFHWPDYDVIKTLFHEGFYSLEKTGGHKHPFIISKVAPVGKHHEQGFKFNFLIKIRLIATQKNISRKAKYVTVLSQANKEFWEKLYGPSDNILLIPTGVDEKIPKPQINPYEKYHQKVAIFAGNICGSQSRELNLSWQQRLNNIGKMLAEFGIKLYFVGVGSQDKLDPEYVTSFGGIPNEKFWDYQYFADCGIVLAPGPKINFESSKIYYYLRTGLPVVSESPVPNNWVIEKAGLGMIVPFGNDKKIVEAVIETIQKKWDKKRAIKYILDHHTWSKRFSIYDEIIKKQWR